MPTSARIIPASFGKLKDSLGGAFRIVTNLESGFLENLDALAFLKYSHGPLL